MRKPTLSPKDVRDKIDELVGEHIHMWVCRGRKQVKRYTGVVENAYKSVFVVRLTSGDDVMEMLSYSYSDILCGEVKITREQQG